MLHTRADCGEFGVVRELKKVIDLLACREREGLIELLIVAAYHNQ